MFKLDREAIFNHPRVTLIDDVVPIDEALTYIEQAILETYTATGENVVQHGRVIALRATDFQRLSSAFKAGLYLGKYDDMSNVGRFLNKMVKAGHSYEPIRGESILFLYIGVGKPVYDHLITYAVGRTTRIAGGQRANLPWGYEVPAETKEGIADQLQEEGTERVRHVVNMTKGLDETYDKTQIQVARSLLPVGYIMPPFLLEFSEEALVKAVFKQRIWEKGAQGATVDIVSDMFECVRQIDPEKWDVLLDYHGPHIARWEKAMRTLRDKEYSVGDFLNLAIEKGLIESEETEDGGEQHDLSQIKLYDILMETVGKLPPNMWEKKK